jgi:hypothetical protein
MDRLCGNVDRSENLRFRQIAESTGPWAKKKAPVPLPLELTILRMSPPRPLEIE